MKKKLRMLCSILLTFVLLSSVCAVSAYAESTPGNTSGVRIVFYKPDNWGDNLKIHLWNAGAENTQWPGVPMTPSGNTYEFSSRNISSCNFVINDENGNQTSDLYAEGYVGVKNNHVFEMSTSPIRICFKAPADWSSDVVMKVYYYTNDESHMEIIPWPGKDMYPNSTQDGYYMNLYDMAQARVMFTDGIHQYPAVNQPGIPVSAGQELIFEENKYTVNDTYNWYYMNQPTTCAYKGEDYHVRFDFVYGDHFSLFFKDENGKTVTPEDTAVTYHNDKVTYDYTFRFTETGTKTLTPQYIYHSSTATLNTKVQINVIEPNTVNAYNISANKYNVNLGDTYTVTAPKLSANLSYSFKDDNGNAVSYTNTFETIVNGCTFVNYVFTADKLGLYQTLNANVVSAETPQQDTPAGKVMLNIWQNVN